MKKFYKALKIIFTVGSVSLFIFLHMQQGIAQTSNQIDKNTLSNQKAALEELNRAVVMGNTKLYFIPNKGQVDEKALYYAKTDKYTLWLTKEGFIFDNLMAKNRKDKKKESNKLVRDLSWLNFINSSKETKIFPLDFTEHEVNYFIGNNPSKWKTSIKTSKAVLYKNLYDKIDLKVYGVEKQIEYDFNVSPGGNPSEIEFEYKGIKDSWIDEEQNLIVETEFGRLKHAKPFCFQVIEEKQIQIKAEFKRIKENTYGFIIEEYNQTFPLFIDPLIFSTYLGDDGVDRGMCIVVDKKNKIYITGYTNSTAFPTRKPFQSTKAGGYDVFITKVRSNGKNLIYSTYLGGQMNGAGQGSDRGLGITVDDKGAVYVTGQTYSKDFPLQNAIQTKLEGCSDVFIAKLNSRGNKLIYSTYLGGNDKDCGNAIAVNKNYEAHVAGWTNSFNFPTEKPFQTVIDGEFDAFIAKISPLGKKLLYSTFFGGKKIESAYDIAVDERGSVYIAGYTKSNDLPTENPYQGALGGKSDAFVTKFNSKGNRLIFSTYLGGLNFDWAERICVDNKKCIYIIGESQSADFPIKKAYQKNLAGRTDAFITKMKPKGNALFFSTYYGGSEDDYGIDIALDNKHNIYLTGETRSLDFPIKNPIQGFYGGGFSDAFVVKFNAKAKSLLYSTYLGGTNADSGDGITVDKNSRVCIIGNTFSTDFPLKNPLFGSYSNQCDVILFKIK